MRLRWPSAAITWLCFVVTCVVGGAVAVDVVAASNGDTLTRDLRFDLPFQSVRKQALALEISAATNGLHVVDGTPVGDAPSVCMNTAGDTCAAPELTDKEPSAPSAHVSDRLVAVDGLPISLESMDVILSKPVGSFVVVPLFTTSAWNGNELSGFARIEILRPSNVTFEPSTLERMADVKAWKDHQAHVEALRLKRQKQREDKAAREEESILFEMTNHSSISQKRSSGVEFRYQVEFTTRGHIGLNWDLAVEGKTIVSHLDPKLPAQRMGLIAPGDQLIQLNNVNTSSMGAKEVVRVFGETEPPRRMVFLCAAKERKKDAKMNEEKKTEDWTLELRSPDVLNGWKMRLHHAPWSEMLDLNGVQVNLGLATPLSACSRPSLVHEAPNVSSGETLRAAVAYRGGCAFLEKAHHVHAMGIPLLIIINNAKGEGRFPAQLPTSMEHARISVGMVAKADGDMLMSVLENTYAEGVLRLEDPEDFPSAGVVVPVPLTNEQMTIAKDPSKSSRQVTFWFIDKSSSSPQSMELTILPALFGGNVTSKPYRAVAAYPVETACFPQGISVQTTNAVVITKRGGCSFSSKLRALQQLKAAGMIMVNTDDSLLPLMSDPRESAGLHIWAASISAKEGRLLYDYVHASGNRFPTFVRVAERQAEASAETVGGE